MDDSKEHDILVVTTTVGTVVDAQRLARLILERRLAACVQLDPAVTSLYWWQDRICEEPEVRLVIKTLPAHAAALQALLATEHTYQLPQFTAMTARASAAYASWLRSILAQSS